MKALEAPVPLLSDSLRAENKHMLNAVGLESERLRWCPREPVLIAVAEVSEDVAVAQDKGNRNLSTSDILQVPSKILISDNSRVKTEDESTFRGW